MNLRIARKILKAVGTPDERRYTGFQIMKARVRWEKTKEAKGLERFWREVVCPALRAETFRPLTDEEIKRALDEAEAVPLSDEQIRRMLAGVRGYSSRRGRFPMMADDAPILCPACLGARTSLVHIYGERDGRRTGEWRQQACSQCGGLGVVTSEDIERINRGAAMAEDRTRRGLSLREEAARLGIAAKELSDREHGRA